MIKVRFNKNVPLALAVIIIIVLFGAFVIRPTILGYSVYQGVKNSNYTIEDYGKNIKELESELLVSRTNLSSYDAFNQKLLIELKEHTDKLSDCNSKLGALKIEFNLSRAESESEAERLRLNINEKIEELENLEGQYNLLVENLANNLCCKAKVDNSNINYYIVENNKIICLEDGTLKITC